MCQLVNWSSYFGFWILDFGREKFKKNAPRINPGACYRIQGILAVTKTNFIPSFFIAFFISCLEIRIFLADFCYVEKNIFSNPIGQSDSQ
ncbi:MAG: hypothetical protein EAZ18_22235 [Oscillatoriales cyanobacterium]|nr:MAG: hypothetical protein EAZ18_22235 [Oscillatoriales cyanobacterium]